MLGDPVRGPARLPRPGDDLARSLRDGEVHVWVVPLVSDGADDDPRLEVLSRDESADMARLRSPRDTRRYRVSHAAARLILAAHAEREPADLESAGPSSNTVRGQAGWHVLDLAPAPGYVGAVAVSDDVAAVVPVGWTRWGGRAPRLGAPP